MQAGVAVFVLLVDAAARRDEDARDAGVAVAGGRVERRVAVLKQPYTQPHTWDTMAQWASPRGGLQQIYIYIYLLNESNWV